MKKIIFTTVLFVIISIQVFSQEYLEKTLNSYQNPDELVTLSSKLSFNQALELLSKVSEKTTGRKIVSTVSIDTVIGIEIKNMNYMKALVVLVKMTGLVYEEKPDVIIVKSPGASEQQQRTKDNYVSIDAREVKISAVFFEADVSKEKQLGLNWQTLFEKQGLNVGGTFNSFTPPQSTTSTTGGSTSGTSGTGTTTQVTPDFNITASSNFNIGGYFGKATAIFKYFESENAGDIISSPNVTVLDGTEARLQDGQDIAYNQRDFSGNIIQKFYSIGSIVTVTPHILEQDGVHYILLNVHVERSSFVPDPTNTIINKTSADTRVVMLNGEETVIGGMFFNQTSKVRKGIPILKDLPWWFFGLRYIFGYDDTILNKKELVILIKTSLIPTIKERLSEPFSKSPLKDELQLQRDKLKEYQSNNTPNKDQ